MAGLLTCLKHMMFARQADTAGLSRSCRTQSGLRAMSRGGSRNLAIVVAGVMAILTGESGRAGEPVMALTGLNSAFVQTFDSFEGTFGSLPTGFSVSKDGGNVMGEGDGDFRGISRGNVTAGGCYAWAVGETNRALGYQPTADEFTPGFFQLAISNATDRPVRYVAVSYIVVWQNNADRSSSLELFFSSDGAALEPVSGSLFVTPGPKAECSKWSSREFEFTICLECPLRPGGIIRLRWLGDDSGGSGSRDEYGLDRVAIRAKASLGTVFCVF